MRWNPFRRRETEAKSVDIISLVEQALFGQNTKSGVAVNVESALRVSTALACGRVIAEGIAQLPKTVIAEMGGGKRRIASEHPVSKVLRRPNDWQTGFEFFETLTLHALFCHGGFAQIARNEKREVVELFPLMPNLVQVVTDQLGQVFYDVTVNPGTGEKRRFTNADILHIRGPSWDRYQGLETIRQGRDALGLAIATEETHAALHANGARPAGVLTVKGGLDEPARERLKASWNAAQGGLRNAFRTAVLDMDASWAPMTQTGVDSQHVELRKHQIEEVCRLFRVFPQMIGHTDKTSTFASSESFFLAHVVHTLGPWVERWEQVFERDLLGDKPGLQVQFNVNGLLRGDANSRATFWEKALGGARGETAFMTRNEVRAIESEIQGIPLDPIEGGDDLPMPPPAPVGVGGSGGGAPPAAPPPAPPPAGKAEAKAGRVLSATNETRIRNASGELDAVLATLPGPGDAE